jgi:uncharacterized coiled-coil protein SlyX
MKIYNVLLFFGFLTAVASAAETLDPTLKLREQLRSVTFQLRTSQTDAANAQAAQATAEQKNTALTAKVADLEKRSATQIKQSSTDKVAADESIAKLNDKLTEREQRIVQYTEALEKWKLGYQKAAEVARTKEDARVKLAAEIVMNKRIIADRESKNITLFNTANEILNRYENYALGKAIGAREPFVGIARVKIENQVQGYKDQILDSRISARMTN